MTSNATPDSVNVLHTSGMLTGERAYTELHMPGGHVVRLPTAWLQESPGSTLASTSVEPVGDGNDREDMATLAPVDAVPAEVSSLVIPLVEERLQVSTRSVATGKVVLHKTVHTYETQLDEPLAVRTFDIERVILNQPVESAPAVRQEGDTTVYPLVEEQLILTKQLVLKEEIRVTRRDTERRDTQTVSLRREHLTVERESA